VPGDIVPGDIVPGDIVPGDIVPGDIVPGDIVPGDIGLAGGDSVIAEGSPMGRSTPAALGTGAGATGRGGSGLITSSTCVG